MTTPPQSPQRILIIPAAGLGDLVMAAPVIHALRNHFPDSHLAVLAHHNRGAADLARCIPYLDETIDFPLTRYCWPAVLRFFTGPYWSLLRRLRRAHFDTVIILCPNPIRTILCKMLNPPTTLTVTGSGHPTSQGLELITQLGCSAAPLDFAFKIPHVTLDAFLPADLPRPWIGLHPFSAMQCRRWHNADQLIKLLNSTSGTVILFGRQPDHVYKPIPGTIDLVNRLSVTELTAAINKLDVLVSTDSGPMHLGFATATPTIALFGPVPPTLRMPLTNTIKHTAIYHQHPNHAPLTTVKERKPITTDYLNQITAKEVHKAVNETLSRVPKA